MSFDVTPLYETNFPSNDIYKVMADSIKKSRDFSPVKSQTKTVVN